MTREEWIIEAMSLANAFAAAAVESAACIVLGGLTGRPLQAEKGRADLNVSSTLESLKLHLNNVPEFIPTTTEVKA